jgi:hypothetical protein
VKKKVIMCVYMCTLGNAYNKMTSAGWRGRCTEQVLSIHKALGPVPPTQHSKKRRVSEAGVTENLMRANICTKINGYHKVLVFVTMCSLKYRKDKR